MTNEYNTKPLTVLSTKQALWLTTTYSPYWSLAAPRVGPSADMKWDNLSFMASSNFYDRSGFTQLCAEKHPTEFMTPLSGAYIVVSPQHSHSSVCDDPEGPHLVNNANDHKQQHSVNLHPCVFQNIFNHLTFQMVNFNKDYIPIYNLILSICSGASLWIMHCPRQDHWPQPKHTWLTLHHGKLEKMKNYFSCVNQIPDHSVLCLWSFL